MSHQIKRFRQEKTHTTRDDLTFGGIGRQMTTKTSAWCAFVALRVHITCCMRTRRRDRRASRSSLLAFNIVYYGKLWQCVTFLPCSLLCSGYFLFWFYFSFLTANARPSTKRGGKSNFGKKGNNTLKNAIMWLKNNLSHSHHDQGPFSAHGSHLATLRFDRY